MSQSSIEVTPQEAHFDASEGRGVLVDVREPWEWAAGAAAGAVRLSLRDLPERHAELPRGQRVLCICASGNRSRAAAEYLRAQGYDALSVAGGTIGWQLHRLPIDRA
jgi:rhodanese-related sulfurtransferase